ncbi:MAG: TolC family protein [Bacteroidales bacterium]|nr:TolC family protein [Bacteroidales bacterium]
MKIALMIVMWMALSVAAAQKILTIEEATAIALKNNFGILVARNEAEIAAVNNTRGNAGMLPEVSLAGSGIYEVNDLHQKLSGGTENSYPSLSTTSVNAGAELSWTLFDGGRMFVTKNKLEEIEALGAIQFQAKVLETLYSVVEAYYDVVRQNQQLASINESLNFNRERVIITQTGFDAGTLAKTDFLQSKIDLNVTMENVIRQQFVIATAKSALSELLGQDDGSGFEVSDSIPLGYSPHKDSLFQRLYTSNTNILSMLRLTDIARLSLKENHKLYSPVVQFRAGYYLSYSRNSEGSVLQSRSFGPLLGGNISIPLYGSGENRRKIAVAKLELETAEYGLLDIKIKMNLDLQNAFTDFENQQRLLQIEKENNELARENLEISLQRLKLGQTTSLEVRQAEESFVQSCTRLINFRYNLKMAETKLKQLVAGL